MGLFSWGKKNKKDELNAQKDISTKAEEQRVVNAEHDVKLLDETKAVSKIINEEIEKEEVSLNALKSEDIADEERMEKSSDLNSAEDFNEHNQLRPSEIRKQEEIRKGVFSRLLQGLKRTKQNIGYGFVALFKGKKIDDDLFEELETNLLMADLGIETTQNIIKKVTEQAKLRQLHDAEALYDILKSVMFETLKESQAPLVIADKKPFVVLMVGVNGVGKTTTIGKLAKKYQNDGKSVMLAAGDTFRAAAVEQLQVWGHRNNIPVVAQQTGSDSASVIYDAYCSAKAKKIDVLLVDTAGRLQNKSNLMEELRKIVRVIKKVAPDAPHEVMLVLDSGTGQNAISQAKLFNETVPLTGITLTKLDGTAKGGVIFAIANQFKIPVRYIGVGEGIEDLRTFDAKDFIEALFDKEQE